MKTIFKKERQNTKVRDVVEVIKSKFNNPEFMENDEDIYNGEHWLEWKESVEHICKTLYSDNNVKIMYDENIEILHIYGLSDAEYNELLEELKK